MASSTALARAFVLGVATGGRSSAGGAALVWSSSAARRSPDPHWLTTRAAHVVTALMAGGEAVADKLPSTPSRLAPPALGARLAFGAAAGALLGRRSGVAVVGPAVLGAVGAAAGAFLGARWRAMAAERFGSDRPGALIEDAAVAALATGAVAVGSG